ncbi:hypothetical protein B0T16DRAFT_187182 [Cercophora newfieldiana]|uniref:Secreted protein n=1 Tax=Cercophora newfieldiana TaxID=92897 RepID=A0AA39Y0D1_9PEZI|nr:hypothetical protein B0T16DRAFT_187182 [Cercophora newfieldiana]
MRLLRLIWLTLFSLLFFFFCLNLDPGTAKCGIQLPFCSTSSATGDASPSDAGHLRSSCGPKLEPPSPENGSSNEVVGALPTSRPPWALPLELGGQRNNQHGAWLW